MKYFLILFTITFIVKTKSQNTLLTNRVNFNEDIFQRNKDDVCVNPGKYGFSEKIGTNKYFSISDRLMRWNEGESYCQTFGAHLPIVKNQDENNYLRVLIDKRVWTQAEYGTTLFTWSGYWLGAYKSIETNTIKWIDKSPLIFTNWRTNEPSFDGKIQFYVHDYFNMSSNQYEGWDDQSDWTHSFVICQLDCSSEGTTIKPTIFDYKLNSTITKYGDYVFKNAWGITSVTTNETYFYVTDQSNNRVVILNKNLELIKFTNHASPLGIVNSNNELFVSSAVEKSISKYDFNLNLIKNISNCAFVSTISAQCLLWPTGLHYDLSINLLYVEDNYANGVHVFDNELKRINFIFLGPIQPRSLLYFKTRLYFGTITNQVSIIDNTFVLSATYNNICPTSSTITSVYVYNQQYFLFGCHSDNRFVIYHLNMTSTGKYLSTSGIPVSITSDHQDRLLVVNQFPDGIDVFTNK